MWTRMRTRMRTRRHWNLRKSGMRSRRDEIVRMLERNRAGRLAQDRRRVLVFPPEVVTLVETETIAVQMPSTVVHRLLGTNALDRALGSSAAELRAIDPRISVLRRPLVVTDTDLRPVRITMQAPPPPPMDPDYSYDSDWGQQDFGAMCVMRAPPIAVVRGIALEDDAVVDKETAGLIQLRHASEKYVIGFHPVWVSGLDFGYSPPLKQSFPEWQAKEKKQALELLDNQDMDSVLNPQWEPVPPDEEERWPGLIGLDGIRNYVQFLVSDTPRSQGIEIDVLTAQFRDMDPVYDSDRDDLTTSFPHNALEAVMDHIAQNRGRVFGFIVDTPEVTILVTMQTYEKETYTEYYMQDPDFSLISKTYGIGRGALLRNGKLDEGFGPIRKKAVVVRIAQGDFLINMRDIAVRTTQEQPWPQGQRVIVSFSETRPSTVTLQVSVSTCPTSIWEVELPFSRLVVLMSRNRSITPF